MADRGVCQTHRPLPPVHATSPVQLPSQLPGSLHTDVWGACMRACTDACSSAAGLTRDCDADCCSVMTEGATNVFPGDVPSVLRTYMGGEQASVPAPPGVHAGRRPSDRHACRGCKPLPLQHVAAGRQAGGQAGMHAQTAGQAGRPAGSRTVLIHHHRAAIEDGDTLTQGLDEAGEGACAGHLRAIAWEVCPKDALAIHLGEAVESEVERRDREACGRPEGASQSGAGQGRPVVAAAAAAAPDALCLSRCGRIAARAAARAVACPASQQRCEVRVRCSPDTTLTPSPRAATVGCTEQVPPSRRHSR